MEKYYLNEELDCPPGVPSITSSYDDSVPFPSFVDRYFTRYYFKNKSANGDNEDHLFLCHSNRVGIIMLAKSHIAFKKGIASISYDIGKSDRSQMQVKGKNKKGGMNLQNNTAIAIVKTVDGCEYKVQSCVTSKLLETNEQLQSDLGKLEVEGDGYIAVVLIKHENAEKLKDFLVSEDDYKPE